MKELRWELKVGSPVVTIKDEYDPLHQLGNVTRILTNPEGQVMGLVVQVGWLHRRELIVPFAWVKDADEERICLSVGKNELENLPVYRSDDALAEDVDNALWADEIFRNTDYSEISVVVQDGIVRLIGHVTSLIHKDRAEKAVRSITGVLGLENNLVVDGELIIEVVRAIQGKWLTHSEKISVSARNGFITLAGRVGSAVIRDAAGTAAAGIPQVRGVANHLQAPGLVVIPDEQQFWQPKIGKDVYATDMRLGYVKQVVINPHNRCVTAFVTHCNFSDLTGEGEWQATEEPLQQERDIVLPIRTMIYQGDDGIRINTSGTAVVRLSDFLPSDFASPPADWQPPYPYRPEDILLPEKVGLTKRIDFCSERKALTITR